MELVIRVTQVICQMPAGQLVVRLYQGVKCIMKIVLVHSVRLGMNLMGIVVQSVPGCILQVMAVLSVIVLLILDVRVFVTHAVLGGALIQIGRRASVVAVAIAA